MTYILFLYYYLHVGEIAASVAAEVAEEVAEDVVAETRTWSRKYYFILLILFLF